MHEWTSVENATMPLENLNHVLVLARNLEATRSFFVDVLGLEDGYRPPFPFNGHWIYLGDRAVVHVAENRGYLDKRDHVQAAPRTMPPARSITSPSRPPA